MTEEQERALAADLSALTLEVAILNRRLATFETLFSKYEHLLPKPRGLFKKGI